MLRFAVDWLIKMLPVCICFFALCSPNSASAFSIEFDYRFANGYFDDPVRRKALEDAAGFLESVIADDFPAIPAGTVVTVTHPESGARHRVKVIKNIKDLRVFVFAYPMKKKRKAAAGPLGRGSKVDELSRRWGGSKFQPWIGRVSFNTTPRRPWFFDSTPNTSTDIPSQTHYDFIGTAIHELMHVLGLQSRVPAFRHLVRDNQFYGPRAMALNSGKPIPLKMRSSHIRRGFTLGLPRPNIDNYSIHSGKHFQGLRHMPTALEFAMLSDIGYSIRSNKDLRLPDQVAPIDPRRSSISARCRFKKSMAPVPSGLWNFDRSNYLGAALKGVPIHYMPPARGTRLRAVDDGARIPSGGYLIMDHGLQPQQGDRRVNRYTLSLEVRLPSLGVRYALLNTNRRNRNGAEIWIDKNGRVQGNGNSLARLRAGRWHQIAIGVDASANVRHYYIDGRFVLKERSGTRGERFSLNSVFLLFADSAGRDAPIDVRRVAIFEGVLSAAQIQSLTHSDWSCAK